MKIKSKEQLFDFLDKELSWRKKELFTLKSNVEKSNPKLEATALRSGIVLLYAHWEGFLKIAAESYLEYVISKKLKYKDLSNNFIAICAKQKIKEFEQTNKSTIYNQLIEFLFEHQEDRAVLSKESVIKTQSNLNSIILKEMMTSIGLDFTEYATKANLIDEQLLKYRNNIAHGKHLILDSKDYLLLHDEVRKMLEKFKTDVENAVLLSLYVKNSHN